MRKLRRIISTLLVISLCVCACPPIDALAATTSSKKVYGQVCRGVTDISAKSAVKSEFYVYTSWLSYASNRPYKTYRNTRSISLTCNLSNANRYYVKIVSPKQTTTSCTISQHLDTKKVDNKGIVWIVSKNSKAPYDTLVYGKKVYFTKDQVGAALTYIDNDNVLDTATVITNLTWFVSTSIITKYFPGRFISGLISAIGFVECFGGLDWKTITKKQVAKTAGYTYNNETREGTAKRGIVLKIFYYNGMETIQVESWDGKVAYGEKGYIGKWSY